MVTKTVNLYTFNELSDAAKEKARDWWKECEGQEFGSHDDLNEPFETAAKLLGIEFKTHAVRLMSGKDRYESNIWWTLHTRDCGASFDATYSYAKGSVKAIRSEFPKDTVLHGIADGLAKLQGKYFYRLTAIIRSSHNSHWLEMDYDGFPESSKSADDCEAFGELFKDFARWIYNRINEEWDYCMSDENVDECIQANEYTFTVDGRREDM